MLPEAVGGGGALTACGIWVVKSLSPHKLLQVTNLLLSQKRGLAGYVWRRDASPVFVPMTLAIFISASTWCAYGIIIERIYITIPNGIGAVVALAQLVLRAIFPGTSTSETSQAKLDMAKWVYEDYLKWQRNYRRQSAVVSSDEPSAKGPRLSADVII
ncbi:unnamed protein product [Effrenium voratum]|nr:unnamed protein product [Effrenium voratum]